MPINLKTASPSERKAEYDRIAKELGDDQFYTKKSLTIFRRFFLMEKLF